MEAHDNPVAQRYELAADGELAFAAYQIDGDVITFTHTIVPPEIGGCGVGSRLTAAALADVRDRGMRIVPQCPLVAAYIEKHPEDRSLLA